MAKEIYPKSVFDNQTNGTVFYREGKLNDPMMPNQAGVFESWRYSFDSGRQVFKATDTEKVYEKRLIKDKNGNPHWSEWMEICPGEAHGIQAIAINDRPLLLPNEDGAIKLQITPQMIDTYTKREIYDLITNKINDTYSETYIYVKWVDGCDTAKDVLYATFPNGGEEGKFYLVEPKPEEGKVNNATYFVWEFTTASTKHNGYAFVEANTPDLKSFVSYTAFNEHTNDKKIHITDAERQSWNEDIAALKEDVAKNSVSIEDVAKVVADNYDALHELIEKHMNDVGELTSPHLTIEERQRINSLFQNVREMPDNNNRYVIENGNYVLAFEQYKKATDITKDEFFAKSGSYQHGTYIADRDDGILAKFNELTSKSNLVDRVYLELTNMTVYGDYEWWIEADNGFVTKKFNKNTSFTTIDVPFGVLPTRFVVKTNDPEATVTFDSKMYVDYVSKVGIEVGNKNYALDLVGSEEIPTYNGKPITDLMPDTGKTAEWGRISGTIENQVDLGLKIADAIAGKINHADMSSHLRWDVYRDGVIKSICQQTENAEEKTLTIEANNGSIKNGGELISNIQDKLTALKEEGYVIYSAKLAIENVSAFQDAKTNLPIPVYFTTDNGGIAPSPSFVGKFNYDWPGNFFDNYNTIYVRGGDVEYCTNARLEVKAIKYGDITIGLHNDAEDKDYSITIKADVLNELAEEIVLKAKGNAIIEAAENAKIAAGKVLSIGGKAYDYDADKVDPETDEADNVVSIYGQEADKRYAGRELFETEVEERKAAIEKEIEDRQNADEEFAKIAKDGLTALEGEVNTRLAEIEEDVKEKISEALTHAEELVESVKEAAAQVQENLDEEASIREKSDNALTAVIDANKGIFDDYVVENDKAIEELKASIKDHNMNNVETFDLVINDPEELAATIADGTFESSERILFKKGTYENIDVTKSVSFAGIKYVKAEKEVYINLPNAVAPKAYDYTEFDGMNIILGSGKDALLIDAEGERTKTLEASGETAIELLPQYSIYKIEVTDDTELTFKNVIDGKEYTIFVDQGEDVKNVTVTNFSQNNAVEFSNGLENQAENLRTAIKFIGNNAVTQDGMIVEEVIYGLTANPNAAANIEVVAKNTMVEIYGSKEKAKAVNFDENEVIAIANPGKTFTIAPAILSNWAHNEEGADYKVVCEDGTVIGEGNCDEEATFKVPFSVKANEDGSMPKIEVVFDVKPQLVTIKIDDVFGKYIEASSKEGFTKVQAGQEARLSFVMNDGYTLYGITHDQISNIWQGSFPYVFVPKNNVEHKNYELMVTPKFYREIKDFTLKTVSEYPFNHESVAIVGANEMTIEPEFVAEADANFGTLYTAAPITLVGSNKYSGEVEFEDAGKTQSANIFFNEDTLNTYVDVEFAIAGHNDNIVKTFYIGKVGGSTGVEPSKELETRDGKYIIDTFVGEAREYKFSVKLENVNDASGTWKVSDTKVAKVVGSVDNTVTIAALTKGQVRLMFTSNFTGLTHEAVLLVVTHAKKVDVADMKVSTDTVGLKPKAIWYDANGNVIADSSVISDTTGTYSAPEDNVYVVASEDADSLTVKNVALPEGESSTTEEYSFIPNDSMVEVIDNGVATIIAKAYGVTFTVVDGSDIESVSIYGAENEVLNGSCSVVGGNRIAIVIKLKDNVKGKYEKVLSDAFSYEFNENEVESKPGYFRASLEMPYKNVSFDLN